MRKYERKNAVYVGFIDLEKAYNRVNREVLSQVLRMYDFRENYWVELRACMLIVQLLSE